MTVLRVGAYVGRRALEFVPTILCATFLIYVAMRLLPDARSGPFDLAATLVGYASWLERLLRLDLGHSSSRYDWLVGDVIGSGLLQTTLLAVAGIVICAVVSCVLGVAGALGRGGPLDHFVNAVVSLTLAIPGFVWIYFLLIIFAVELRILPVSGFVDPFTDPIRGLKHLLLPAVVVSFEGIGELTRITRHALLEVLGMDFIRTARGKGLASYIVVGRHGIPNVLVPVATMLGLTFGRVLGGTIIVEQIVNWRGLGRLLLEGINAGDVNLVEGVMLVYAGLFVGVMLAVDAAQAIADPRLRSAAAAGSHA